MASSRLRTTAVRAAPVQHLVHADWSMHPPGRWAALASRTPGGWAAGAPYQVPALDRFLDDLFDTATTGSTLAGFDFPIGLPAAYGECTKLDGFRDALARFGHGEWLRVYDLAETAEEVGMRRPFYPARSGGTRRHHLLDGHAVPDIDALMRRCERGGPGRRAAGSLFWTLGAQQVGRAAIVGWREIVVPALARGAALWPFDGAVADLAGKGGLTLAETYPADVYAFLGAAFRPGESKREQAHRARKAPALLAWAEAAGVAPSPALEAAICDGFGPQDKGGDRFDAVVGLFGMIAVVDGRRCTGVPDDPAVHRWEGWILGRQA